MEADSYSEHNRRSNKLSLIMWAIIKNNQVNQTVYLMFMAADFVYQVCYIFCLYDQVNSFPTNLDSLADVIGLGYVKGKFSYVWIIFPSLIIIYIMIILILILKNQQGQYFNNKIPYFILMGIFMTLISTFFFCFVAQVLINLLGQFATSSAHSSAAYIVLFICIIAIFAFITLIYMSSRFYNLTLPNKLLPWSETSSNTQILRAAQKATLVICFMYRHQESLMYALVAIQLLLVSVQLLQQCYQNIMFFGLVRQVTIIQDMIMIYLLVMLLLTKTVDDPHFMYYVILLLPAVLIAGLVMTTEVHKNLVFQLTRSQSGNINRTARSMTYLLALYLQKQRTENKNALLQLKQDHKFKCNQQIINTHIKYQKVLETKSKKQKYALYNQEVQGFSQSSKQGDHLDQFLSLDSVSVMFKSSNQFGEEEQKEANAANILTRKMALFLPSNSRFTQQSFVEFGKNKGKKTQNHLKNQISVFDGKIQGFQQENNEPVVTKEKKHKFKKIVKHFFKDHLNNEQMKSFKIRLVNIFYLSQVKNNRYWAHFQLLNSVKDIMKQNIVGRNQILIEKLYLEDINEIKDEDNQIKGLNLKNLIQVNQLKSKFDQLMEKVTAQILEFWQQLLSPKDSHLIFEKGISISSELNNLEAVYNEIDGIQNDRDAKFYMKMALFNRYVVLKEPEFAKELFKSKQVLMTNRINNQGLNDDYQYKKGLLVVQINLKNPMIIKFINKTACKQSGYSMVDSVGQPVNILMPGPIKKNHQRFVTHFMETGKSRMLKQSMDTFIKHSLGYVIPVETFVSVNFLNIKYMILMIEKTTNIMEFDQSEDILQGPILVIDETNSVCEFSKDSYDQLGICFEMLDQFAYQQGRQMTIADILTIKGYDENELDYHKLDETIDYEVYFSQKLQIDSNDDNANNDYYQSMKFKLLQGSQQQYTMKLKHYNFLDGKIQMTALQFGMIKTNQPTPKKGRLNSQNDSQRISVDSKYQQAILEQSNIENSEDGLQLQSISSASSSVSKALQRDVNIGYSINSNSAPKTLRFISQLIVFILIIMVVTSITSLLLTLGNYTDAQAGVKISYYSFLRFNAISRSRLMLRALVNINNGASDNNSNLLSNRTTIYVNMFQQSMNDLRTLENAMKSATFPGADAFYDCDVQMMASNTSTYIVQSSFDQALQLYVAKGLGIYDSIVTQGLPVISSQLNFQVMNKTNQTTASLMERDLYLITRNALRNIYYRIRDFGAAYVSSKLKISQVRLKYSSSLQYCCLALILLTGLVCVPLFNRVQIRIYSLMDLFFNVNKSEKMDIIESISTFQTTLLASKIESASRQKQKTILDLSKKSPTNKKTKAIVKKEEEIDEEKKNKISKHNNTRPQEFEKTRIKLQSSKKLQIVNSSNYDDDESKIKNDSQRSKIRDLSEIDDETRKEVDKNSQENTQAVEQGLSQFQMYIKKRKIYQAVTIIALSVILSTYFVVAQLLSKSSFDQMQLSLALMRNMVMRKGCMENVMFGVYETLSRNQTVNFSLADGSSVNIAEYFHNFCLDQEATYNIQVKTKKPSFLGSSLGVIAQLETSGMCDLIYKDNSVYSDDVTYNNASMVLCKTALNNITSKGFTAVLYQIFQVSKQVYIDYTSLQTKSYPNIRNAMNGQFNDLLDLLEVIMHRAQRILTLSIVSSINDYFESQKSISLIIFMIFISLVISITMIFAFSIFKKLKREMLLSNKLLYLLDLENLDESEKNNIMSFLAKF